MRYVIIIVIYIYTVIATAVLLKICAIAIELFMNIICDRIFVI